MNLPQAIRRLGRAGLALAGLDLPNPAVVRVGGKTRTVLARGVLDGTGWRPMLHKHPGLVQDGLTDSASGFYDYIHNGSDYSDCLVAPAPKPVPVETAP